MITGSWFQLQGFSYAVSEQGMGETKFLKRPCPPWWALSIICFGCARHFKRVSCLTDIYGSRAKGSTLFCSWVGCDSRVSQKFYKDHYMLKIIVYPGDSLWLEIHMTCIFVMVQNSANSRSYKYILDFFSVLLIKGFQRLETIPWAIFGILYCYMLALIESLIFFYSISHLREIEQ